MLWLSGGLDVGSQEEAEADNWQLRQMLSTEMGQERMTYLLVKKEKQQCDYLQHIRIELPTGTPGRDVYWRLEMRGLDTLALDM